MNLNKITKFSKWETRKEIIRRYMNAKRTGNFSTTLSADEANRRASQNGINNQDN